MIYDTVVTNTDDTKLIVMYYDGCSKEIYFNIDYDKHIIANDDDEFKPFIANFEKKCDITYDESLDILQCGNEFIHVHKIKELSLEKWKKPYYAVYVRDLLNTSYMRKIPYLSS